MPRDAFGREQGEDALEGMGWTSSAPRGVPVDPDAESDEPAPPVPTPSPLAPTPSPAPVTGAAPPWASAPRPGTFARPPGSGRRPRGLVALFLLVPALLALGVIGSCAVSIVGTAKDAIDLGEQITLPQDVAEAPASRQSMLGPAGLRPALARARQEGKLRTLRVAVDRVDAQLVDAKGRLVVLDIPASGDTHRVVATAAPPGDPIPWSAVDPKVPMRIARAAARDAHRTVGRVDYLVLLGLSDGPEWELFFKDGVHYSAGVRGRHLRRVG
jgi:hypothetical protein